MSATASHYCFLDANVFIHFQTFDEVGWDKLLGVPAVQLVLTPAVMRELNDFKDDHANERRRKRVRAILAKLRLLLRQRDADGATRVRPGVTLSLITREPQPDWRGEHLDPDLADDRLLASMLECGQAHPDATLMLVTNDFLLHQKAIGRGFVSHEAEDLLPSQELPSPEAVTIKKLDREVQDLRSRIPMLSLAFREGHDAVQLVTRPPGQQPATRPSNADLDRYLETFKAEFEKRAADAPQGTSGMAVRDFVEEYTKHLAMMRASLIKLRARDNDWRVDLSFVLENCGSVAAEDSELTLVFPKESFVIAVEDVADDYLGFGDLELPRKPVPRWPRKSPLLHSYMPPFPPIVSQAAPLARQPVPRGPLYDTSDRSIVAYRHPKLWPKTPWPMEPVAAYVPAFVGGGFSIGDTINADRLPEPLTGQLHVRFASPLPS